MKDLTRKAIAVVAVMALVGIWLLSGSALLGPSADVAQAQGLGSNFARTIQVSGNAQISAQPDLAVVTLGVETQAEDASTALTENSTQMDAVITALEDAGVAAEDIQTQSVGLSPVYEAPTPTPTGQQGAPQLVAFRASNIARVQIRDLEEVGSILDAAVQAGGNQIQGITFELENPGDLTDQARTAAWEDAMQKAQQLSHLAGVQLGAVISVQESGGAPIALAQERVAVGGAVPIQPGTVNVNINMQVTWEVFVVPGGVMPAATPTPTASGSTSGS